MGRVLTVEQAAQILHLNPQVVREYLRTGKLPGTKLGRHWRILEEDLIAVIQASYTTNSTYQTSAGTVEKNKVAETAAQYPHQRAWSDLNQEERIRRIKSIQGQFARKDRSVDDFLHEKHQEVEEEEQRWEERHRK